ncbi:MAG: glycerol-3-phosphate 1-O-acyltransferase PlsY [Pseudomonadota bacterium]
MPEIEISLVQALCVALGGYLLGSVPFGILIARLFGLGDLRSVGSGNIGATNVLRTGSKLGALFTLLLDAGKGVVALLIARSLFGEDAAQLAGLSAFIGHLYPIWLRFQGGKGVATFLGLLLALSFALGLYACAAWLVAAVLSRRSSLGALSASLVSPGLAWLIDPSSVMLCAMLTFFVWLRHKANIQRVMEGTEPKITF